MKKARRILKRRATQRTVSAKGKAVHIAPPKLPPLAATYCFIYSLFLKHAMKKSRISGKLFEIGAGYGQFLNMLCTDPFFTSNSKFSASGINAGLVDKMPPAARKVTAHATVEKHVQQHPEVRGKADFVVATNVLDGPTAKPEKIFPAISKLTKKGGKVFLQTQKPEEMPSREIIKREGFKIIDTLPVKDKYMPEDPWVAFVLVLQKVK